MTLIVEIGVVFSYIPHPIKHPHKQPIRDRYTIPLRFHSEMQSNDLMSNDQTMNQQPSNALQQKIEQWLQDPRFVNSIRESCPAIMLGHGIAGFAFGSLMGIFLSGMASEVSVRGGIPMSKSTVNPNHSSNVPVGNTVSPSVSNVAASGTSHPSVSSATSNTLVSSTAGKVTQNGTVMVPIADLPIRAQVRAVFSDMLSKAWRTGKNFGLIGGMFSGIECVVEGHRAKHDLWNPAIAGFVSGAILARKSSLRAMALGGAGFAAFSSAIEWYMSKRESDD